ncbi:hypothetical protein [Teredinibacter turnerae]|uniref:hypothetical protein n=1 Tax=Teredinibacter turnerae TaxID=2426 RepID=UPI0030D61061
MEIEISEDGFINMLRNHNGGALVDELDRELIKGISAIQDFGSETKVGVVFTIKRIKEMTTAVNIIPTVTKKHPEEPPTKGAMFISRSNGLITQKQEQQQLQLEGNTIERKTTLAPINNPVSSIGQKGKSK